MEEKSKPTPNLKLRRERDRRMWSQQELADRVGTTPLNIGRWERGVTQPGPYFRQKLCEVFEKNAYELGFASSREDNASIVDQVQPVDTSTKTSMPATQTVPLALWNVPYRRNLFFTGREDTLAHLHDAFTSDTSTIALAQPQAISGLGGIGKTQTAVEYAYRFRDNYQVILWVRAESSDLLVSDFLTIATLLNLPERNEQDQSQITNAVIRWFDTHDHWLLILDNADELDAVSEYIPSAGRGHILLTTRSQAVGTVAERIELDTMSKDEGTLFLLRRTKKLRGATSIESVPTSLREQAQAIVEAVDCLPLALDQAAAYIEESSCSLSDYLKFYKTKRTRLLRMRGKDAAGHPEPVAATWSLSFEKIEHANPAAADLLRLCAFLHPDAIPETMLTERASELGSVLSFVAADELDLNEAIGQLLRYSLIKRDANENVLNIHRLVQAVVRDGMKENEERMWVERVVKMISKVFPKPQNVESWSLCQLYLPHAQITTLLVEQAKITSLEAAMLFNNLGSFIYQRKGSYTEAESLLNTALTLVKIIQGVDTSLIAEYMNTLAEVYHDQLKYKEAAQLYTEALEIWKHMPDSADANIAGCLNNLGLLADDQSEFEKAMLLHQQALAIRKQVFGLEHEETAQSMAHLAQVYLNQGKDEEAEELFLHSLQIRERVLSPEHPSLAASLSYIGSFYQERGKYALAEHYMRRALIISEHTLDAQHPTVATTIEFLASILTDRERYTEAETLCLQALKIREADKTNESGLVSCLNILGKLYYKQGKYALAEVPCERALRLREQIYGTEHGVVAQSLTNLAQIYRAQGKYEEAQPLLERALLLRIRLFGSEHFNVAHTLYALALLHREQGKDEQAEAFFQQALTMRERGLGPLHPDVAITLENYAILLRKLKRDTEAEALQARAQAIRAHQS